MSSEPAKTAQIQDDVFKFDDGLEELFRKMVGKDGMGVIDAVRW